MKEKSRVEKLIKKILKMEEILILEEIIGIRWFLKLNFKKKCY